jgi:hypothetical protein
MTLMCEETGDTFKNPRNLEDGFIDKCLNCGENSNNFATADSGQILKSGFTKDDYE